MQRHVTRTYFFSLVLLLIAPVAARADEVDDFVKTEMQRQHIPGVSIAVVIDGKIIKAEGYGLANAEHNIPAKPETVYQIGSVSKQLIAAGILLLMQDAKVSLDDKLSKFLDGTPDTWKEITVRHLLTHTSGIVQEAPGFHPHKIQNDAEVIKTAYPLPLRFTPGEKWEYSNVGYFALAEIIRKVSGKPWGDYLNEHLFQPLGMNATRTTTTSEIVPNRADGYVWRDGTQRNADIFFAVRPSGAFISTVLDLAKWDAALNSDQVLNPATRELMWTPVKLSSGAPHPYGFGWQLDAVNGHKRVQHGGSLPGFRATLARYVDDKLTVIVLTNGDNAMPGTIALGIAEAYIPSLISRRPDENTPSKVVDPKTLARYVGAYQMAPGMNMVVTLEGSHLVAKPGNQSAVPLFPESETKFFAKVGSAKIEFEFAQPDSARVAGQLIMRQNGRDRTMNRLSTTEIQQIEAERKEIADATAAAIKRFKDQTPDPRTEAALRRNIDDLLLRQPKYEKMSSGLANATRQQLPQLKPTLTKLGALQSVTFKGVASGGADIYEVKFEHGSTEWRILMQSDEKIASAGFRAQ